YPASTFQNTGVPIMKIGLLLLALLPLDPKPTETQDNPLHIAVNRGDLQAAQAVLDKTPALVNAVVERETPLIVAVKNSDEAMVRMLLKYKADPNQRTDHDPPLHLAVTPRMAKLLLDHGANPELRSHYNQCLTPVQVAAEDGRAEVAKVLVAAGAKMD